MAPRTTTRYFRGGIVPVMSLISYIELCALVTDGVISNCPWELINGASIDVTLAPVIKIETASTTPLVVDFRAREALEMFGLTIDSVGLELLPGEFILASSEQLFNLPNNIAMELKLKSSAARVGLEHLGAGWADPTWHGSALTMELVNCTRNHSIRLRPGDRIAQVVFFHCIAVPDHASYKRR